MSIRKGRSVTISDVAEAAGVSRAAVSKVIRDAYLDLTPGQRLVYGQSITDGCIDWAASVGVLERLADAVEMRRRSAL